MNKTKPSKFKLFIYAALSSVVAVFGFYLLFPLNEGQAKVALDNEERDFIEKINNYREKKGLSSLKISVDLSEAAMAMAKDMAKNPSTINHEHKDSKGRLPAERASLYGYTDGVGENLAAGYETANKVFEAWKDSTEHNANMIDEEYEVMGVALVTSNKTFVDSEGKTQKYKWYWVNMFGQKEHSSDLMDKSNYEAMIKVRITVTDPNGKPLGKAKINILNKSKHKVAGGKVNTKGKKTFLIDPRDEFYVRGTATGYKFYTKRVKPGNKNDVSVKLWLEKE